MWKGSTPPKGGASKGWEGKKGRPMAGKCLRVGLYSFKSKMEISMLLDSRRRPRHEGRADLVTAKVGQTIGDKSWPGKIIGELKGKGGSLTIATPRAQSTKTKNRYAVVSESGI